MPRRSRARRPIVINRTLNKDPDQRYQSYDELIEHLEYAREELSAAVAKPAEARRVVIETVEDKKAVGWMVFVMIGCIIAAVVAGFIYRDKMFPPPIPKKSRRKLWPICFPTRSARWQTEKPRWPPKPFTKLRQSFASQNSTGPTSSKASRKWSPAIMRPRSPFSKKSKSAAHIRPMSKAIFRTFFVDAAREMQIAAPTEPDMLKGIDPKTHQAILPLLYGVKNWDIGRIDEAVALFKIFRQTTPTGRAVWIEKLKPLGTAYLEEFNSFEAASAHLKSARTDAQRKAALDALSRIKGKLAPRAQAAMAAAARH